MDIIVRVRWYGLEPKQLGELMASLVLIGVQPPATAELRARPVCVCGAWIQGLELSLAHHAVLRVLNLVDEAESGDGRCIGVTYTARVAPRTVGLDDLQGIDEMLCDLVAESELPVQPAGDVCASTGPGRVLSLSRTDGVLAVESAKPLWMLGCWVRLGSRGPF